METSESCRERGNELYKEKDYLAALRCYNHALQLIDETDAISSVLCNCATVSMKIDSSLGSSCMAVAYAASSLAIAPCYEKARVRLLNELPRHGETKIIQHGDELQADQEILLAVSDALERCFDEMLVRRVEIAKQPCEDKAIDLKAKGNALFADRKFPNALVVYLSAIHSAARSSGVALVLSNRAICYQHLGQPTEALLSAIAAICCDPMLVKAHFHRASAISSLGQTQKAADAASCGLQLDPTNFALLQLGNRLTKVEVTDPLAASGTAEREGTASAPDAFM